MLVLGFESGDKRRNGSHVERSDTRRIVSMHTVVVSSSVSTSFAFKGLLLRDVFSAHS